MLNKFINNYEIFVLKYIKTKYISFKILYINEGNES